MVNRRERKERRGCFDRINGMDRIPQLKDPDRSFTRITRICTNPKETEGNGDEESGVLRSGTEANKGNEGQIG